MFVCICAQACTCYTNVLQEFRAQLTEIALTFYQVDSKDQAQVVRLSGKKNFYLLSHLTSLLYPLGPLRTFVFSYWPDVITSWRVVEDKFSLSVVVS